MTRIDENKEAFARIRMAVNEYDAACRQEDEDEDDQDSDPTDLDEVTNHLHWSLGSPLPSMTAEAAEREMRGGPHSKKFCARLRTFLSEFAVQRPISQDEPIIVRFTLQLNHLLTILYQIRRYRCLKLRYQSHENWTEEVDILRCNPKFHNNARYDYVLVNNDSDDLRCAHLLDVFRCSLSDGASHDIALVHMLKPSKWRPKTKWDGYRVYE